LSAQLQLRSVAVIVAMGYRRFENRTARFVALVTVKDRVGFGVSVAFVTGRIIRRLSAFWNDYFDANGDTHHCRATFQRGSVARYV
jgi:hypothetical protein